MSIRRPSFRAKARSAAVEESPSSRPDDSLSGRLRFLDSLRSLGMTLTAYADLALGATRRHFVRDRRLLEKLDAAAS